MRSRRHLRQLSKSQLAETTRVLASEREVVLATQGRRWRRVVVRASLLTLLLGVVLGAAAARLDTLVEVVHHLRR